METSKRSLAERVRSGSTGPIQRGGAVHTDFIALYERMVLLRQFELAVQACHKKGDLPGFIHLYVGQEAVATGICANLRPTDWITSTHRGHGHVLAKGTPPRALMAELFGRATGCCGGRGGSMHLYDPTHGVFGTNGIVAAGIPHAVGAAIGARTRGTDDVAVAFFGDGATGHGAFHESLNFASAQKAAAIFVCENNLYATATPFNSVAGNADVAARAAAYGVPGVTVDGNDVLAVSEVARAAVERARRGEGPTLIEAKTYRVVGHHEGEPLVGTYRSRQELEAWKARCPINGFRKKLTEELAIVSLSELEAVDAKVAAIIADALDYARGSPNPDTSTALANCLSVSINDTISEVVGERSTTMQTWLDAVRDGLAEEMRRNPDIIYFGEGTGERGGSFAHTKGLWQEFGDRRMIDTPICELAFTGAAIGASATGCRSVADLMFGDFLFETGCQIPLQAAKLRYMSNGAMSAPVVVRAGCGAIKSAGPHHSGMYHSMWGHLPGLIVAVPSNPADAKGLMKSALRSPDPVIFLEPKALFSAKGEVPTGEYTVPFGVARVERPGRDITIVTLGRLVPMVANAARTLSQQNIECEVIDLRTIAPLDLGTIISSVEKTNRLLIVDEGYPMFGVGAEIATAINERAFDYLDGPVGRLHTEPVPHPFNPGLEEQILPSVEKIITSVRDVIQGVVRAPTQARVITKGDRKSVPAAASISAYGSEKAISGVEAVPAEVINEVKGTGIEETIAMPHGDLTVDEGKVVGWMKKVGDTFEAGDIVAELETAKSVVEIEAPAAGRLTKIFVQVGETVAMGAPLASFAKVGGKGGQ